MAAKSLCATCAAGLAGLAAAGTLWFTAAVVAQAPATDGRIHIAVDDPRDLPDAAPGDGLCAAAQPDARCTLRAAFDEAGASGRATTIGVPAGVFTVTHGHVDLTLTSDYLGLVVPGGADIALEGAGAARTTIAVNDGLKTNPMRTFVVYAGGRLVVHGVTLRGAAAAGGLLNFGRLGVADAIVTDVRDVRALLRIGPSGSLAITSTVVAGNDVGAVVRGEGSSTTQVISSTVQDNHLDVVVNTILSATLRFEASAIVANDVRAGLIYGAAPVTIVRTTIAYNALASDNDTALVCCGDIELRHVTIGANTATTADTDFVARGLLPPPGFTVVKAARLTLAATVIGANDGIGKFGLVEAACAASALDSAGDSIVQAATCADPSRGDRVVDDADLGALEDAGGPTPVLLPRPSSPAIGASRGPCPAHDVRGAPLPAGGPCAAGAADPSAPRPPSGLLWPIRPTFPRGGPDAPQAAEGFFGPPAVLAVRGALGVTARGRVAQALVATGGPVAVGSGSVRLGSPMIEAALDGTTAWLMHEDTRLTAVDVAEPRAPRIAGRIDEAIARDLSHPVVGLRLAVPSPGVLWRVGWRGTGLRGYASYTIDAWDVADPGRPKRIGFTEEYGLGNTATGIAWSSDRIATIRLAYLPFGAIDRSLEVYPAPSAQTRPSGWRAPRLDLDGRPSRVAIWRDHAFVLVRGRDAGRPDGVQVVDLRDLEHPATIGWWPEPWDDFIAIPDGLLLQRGSDVARADLTDPLRPRVVARATWPTHAVELRSTDGDPIARLADGRLVRVDVAASDGPRAADGPAGGDAVLAVAGAGEDLAWRGADGVWRTAAPDTPARPWRSLPGGAWATNLVAVSEGIVWQASVRGVEGFAGHLDGGPLGTADAVGATALAAAGGRLWTLQPGRLALWDVADPARPALAHAWAVDEDIQGADIAADADGAVLWSTAGLIWLLQPGDAGIELPPPAVVRAEPIVAAAREDGRLAVLDAERLRAYDVANGAARALGDVAIPGAGRGLALVGGRAYALAGQRIYVVDVAGDAPAPIFEAPATGAVGPIALVGGRLFAAADGDGLLAFTVGAPDPPALLAACGSTWPGPRAVAVRAPGATWVLLRRDGAITASGAPGGDGAPPDRAVLSLTLPVGRSVLDAVALRGTAPPRVSAPVVLQADASMPFDPTGVTFDDGRSGPLHVGDTGGCATAADGWTVRVDARRDVTVTIPIRADLAATAAVTVTLGGRVARLSPQPGNTSMFAGTVDRASGPGDEAGASEVVVEVAAGDERTMWRGRVVREQVWLPWAGR